MTNSEAIKRLEVSAGPRIVTSFIYPPIPIRKFDWQAYVDGQEEEGPYGYGETKSAAVADLMFAIIERAQHESDEPSEVELWARQRIKELA